MYIPFGPIDCSTLVHIRIFRSVLCAGFIDGLGDAVEQGLVKAVGVSNYNGLAHSLSISFNRSTHVKISSHLLRCEVLAQFILCK